MTELLDIVNEHDELVGKAPRKEVHDKNLLHRGVVVVVFNSDGKIFVQLRSKDKDRFPDCFEASMSGHVLSGELPSHAAVRELREELGINTTPSKLEEVVKFGINEHGERMWVTLFALKDFKGEIKLDEDEVVKGEFWAMSKINKEFENKNAKLHPLFERVIAFLTDFKVRRRDFICFCVFGVFIGIDFLRFFR